MTKGTKGKARRSGRKAERAFAFRLLQHLVVPTFVLDADRRVILWNKACERLTGMPAAEVIGTRRHWRAFYADRRHCLADLVALGRTDRLAELYPIHSGADDDSRGLSAENWCNMPLVGKELYLAMDAGPVFDDEGNLAAVVETMRDMTEQKLARMALESLAVKDGLTGLANRRAFDQTLLAEWRRASREGRPLCLLLADVDHFKAFNDGYGHQQGDECLRMVAAAIGRQAFRPSDLSARYGGEEFAVIVPATPLEGGRLIAERIRRAVEAMDLHHSGGDWGRVTVSIGVAGGLPPSGDDPRALVARADDALYQAKRAGRNRTVALAL